MKNPFISVIIPVHNDAEHLGKCLESVFSSSYTLFEVIVVDDASSDDVNNVTEKFPCRFARNKQRVGSGPSRNKGAKLARGETLVFLDSDCIVHRGWLLRIVEDFREFKIDAVAGQYSGFVEDAFISKFSFYELLFREGRLKRYVKTFPSCNFACKRDAFFNVGGFSEIGRYSDDLEFSYRFGKKYKILWEPKIHVKHHFPSRINVYACKQFISSRDDVPLFLANKKMLVDETFEDKMNYFEVLITALFLASFFCSFLSFKAFALSALGFLIAIALFNIPFFVFLGRKEDYLFAVYSLPLVYFRNFIWLLGGLSGFVLAAGGRT